MHSSTNLWVELAMESDIPRLMEIQFSAFALVPVDAVINGPNTPDFRQKAGDRLINQMRNDPSLHTIKCVRRDTNTREEKIIGFCEWFIHDKERSEDEWKREHLLLDCRWIVDDAQRAKARSYVLPVFEARMRIMRGKPYALLMFLCVDPEHQRQGAGAELLNWGTGKADHLRIPSFLESSPFGYELYKRYGFEDVDQIAVMVEEVTYYFPAMVREPAPKD